MRTKEQYLKGLEDEVVRLRKAMEVAREALLDTQTHGYYCLFTCEGKVMSEKNQEEKGIECSACLALAELDRIERGEAMSEARDKEFTKWCMAMETVQQFSLKEVFEAGYDAARSGTNPDETTETVPDGVQKSPTGVVNHGEK